MTRSIFILWWALGTHLCAADSSLCDRFLGRLSHATTSFTEIAKDEATLLSQSKITQLGQAAWLGAGVYQVTLSSGMQGVVRLSRQDGDLAYERLVQAAVRNAPGLFTPRSVPISLTPEQRQRFEVLERAAKAEEPFPADELKVAEASLTLYLPFQLGADYLHQLGGFYFRANRNYAWRQVTTDAVQTIREDLIHLDALHPKETVTPALITKLLTEGNLSERQFREAIWDHLPGLVRENLANQIAVTSSLAIMDLHPYNWLKTEFQVYPLDLARLTPTFTRGLVKMPMLLSPMGPTMSQNLKEDIQHLMYPAVRQYLAGFTPESLQALARSVNHRELTILEIQGIQGRARLWINP